MTYNLTALNNVDSVFDVVIFADDASGGILVGLFVIAIFVVALFTLKRYDFDFALLGSSFGTFVISAILAYGGLLNLIYPLAFLAILAFTAFFVFIVKN